MIDPTTSIIFTAHYARVLPQMAAPPARPTKGAAKPWLKGQTDDLASLANLDEVVLLEELKTRYNTDMIYVCCIFYSSVIYLLCNSILILKSLRLLNIEDDL